MPSRDDLESQKRDQLIERALRFGVPRPEVMTRVELIDEILRRQETDSVARRRARGWLGVARDLVASLIEQGFNMPDAAALVRTGGLVPTRLAHQPPVATVTLAEIYAAQGHVKRALGMLDEVLAKEPEHGLARSLHERLSREQRPEPELEPEPVSAPEPELEPEPERLVLPVPIPVPDPVPDPEPTPVRVVAPSSADIDAVVTLPLEDGELFVYFELADASTARARARAPEGRAVLRLIAVEPSLLGSRRIERELEVTVSAGSFTLPSIGERAIVRAALGWRSEAGFLPFAVGVELDDGRVRFAPPGSRDAEVEKRVQRRALEAASARS